jgi:hypothetical protein
MATILFFIIYLSNIICIICIKANNNFFASKILKKLLPNKSYKKLFRDYNINIQLTKDNKIVKEYFINTTYMTKDFLFDYSYSGKIFWLNDTNLNLLSTAYYNSKVLLIKQNTTFNTFIKQNKPFIKYITKVIIVPNNTIANLNIIAKYCFYDLSILIIELDENIFDELENYDQRYSINIISKKVDAFPFGFLYMLLLINAFLLFLFSYIYKILIKMYQFAYNFYQTNFYNTLHNLIDFKIFLLLLLYIELNLFYNVEGIIFEYTSFLQSLLIFFMIINEATFVSFIQRIYYGIGINLKGKKIVAILMGYLTGLHMVFYILFNVFINPLRIPYAFYILNLFISFPNFVEMVYFSLKNIIFLCKAYSKVHSVKIYDNKYGKGIRLKILMIISQFIILLLFGFGYLMLHEYLLFKKGLCFSIEKDILFQCLESFFVLFLAIIYFPREWPYGFELQILMIHNSKKTSKINILSGDNYTSSLPKDELKKEEDIKNYVRNNRNKYYVVLNPKIFFDKNKKDKEGNNDIIEEREKENFILGKNIKLEVSSIIIGNL